MKYFLSLGFLLSAIAVCLGAFGAHGLKDYFIGREEEIWKTAVFYQFIHAFGILVVVVLRKLEILSIKTFLLSASFFAVGILIFSGSLYMLVLTRERWLGAVTPLGGVLLILSWVILLWQSLRQERFDKL